MIRPRPYLAVGFALLLVTSMVAGPALASPGSTATSPRTGASDVGSTLSTAPAPTSVADGGGALAAGTTGTQSDGDSSDGTDASDDAADSHVPDDLPEIDGSPPRDLDGDGRYEDVTGDGTLGQTDVIVFFRHQHREDWKLPRYFDYTGDGTVGHGDVTRLFEELATGDAETRIEPRPPEDSDEDGLPDRFEREVAGTDPTDHDSNSSLTAAKESANGVADAREDLNGNGLVLGVAAAFDLDPLANDTDGDGLPDAVEVRYDELDPTATDSDGDGTDDPAVDLDDDSLTNVDEVEHGTALRRADTDADGVPDAAELENGTDPVDRDSDGDGLSDGFELDERTDPTQADSDSDGTDDANETFTRSHEHEETGVTATAEGPGTTPWRLWLQQSTVFHHETPASASPTVRVRNADAQNSVAVTLPVTREEHRTEDLAVYAMRPERNATWERRETTLSDDGATATATIERDQYVTVLNATDWEAGLEGFVVEPRDITDDVNLTACGEGCRVENGTVVLEGETNGSDADGGDGGAETDSPKAIEPIHDPCPLCGVIGDYLVDDEDGDSSDDTDSDISDDTDSDSSSDDTDSSSSSFCDGSGGLTSKGKAQYCQDSGSTDDSDSSSDDTDSDSTSTDDDSTGSTTTGFDSVDSTSDSDGTSSDDTTTDSDGDGVPDADDECPDAEGTGEDGCPWRKDATASFSVPTNPETVTMTTWYRTEGADRGDVELLAEGSDGSQRIGVPPTDGGRAVAHLDVSELGGQEVSVSVATSGASATVLGFSTFRDTDGDELVDGFEEANLSHSRLGGEFQTDPELADTDGDGLDDGDEVTANFDGVEWEVSAVRSDPTAADSDDDGLDDAEEQEVHGTDPLEADTSGDGMSDLVDPAPTDESSLPKLRYRPLHEATEVDAFASEDLYLYVTANPTGDADEIEEIEVQKCWEDPPGDVRVEQDRECQTAQVAETMADSDAVDAQRPSSSTAKVPYSLYYRDGGAVIPKLPDAITVTAIDDDGNRITAEVDTAERRFLTRGSVAASVAAGTRNLRTVSYSKAVPTSTELGLFARFTVVTGGAVVIDRAVDSVGEDVEAAEVVRHTSTTVPETGEEGSWQLPERGVELTLPTGATYEGSRGFGWKHIQSTSLTQADLQHVVRNPTDVIEEDGEVRYVIGEGTDGIEKVILSIIGGTIVAASTDGYVNDPCDGSTLVDLEHEEDHYTRNPEDSPEKPYDDRSAVKALLEDGIDVALQTATGGKRYYIKRVGQNQWTVMVLVEVGEEAAKAMKKGPGNSFTDWFVKTFLTGDGKQYFDSAEKAKNAIPEATEEIDC